MINTSSNLGEYRKQVNQLEEDINNVSESLESATNSLSSSITNIQNSYLPLSGGGMKGNIRFDNGTDTQLYKNITNGRFIVRGGDPNFNGGASLYLHGKDHSEAGAFSIYAHNGTTSRVFTGRADGTLSWNGSEIRFVKTTYNSGTTWYRIWSDGWIEQGGKYTGTSGTCWSTTITFPKAFSNTNYNISVTSTGLAGDMWGEHGENVESITTSSFKYYFYTGASGDGTTGFYWTACGY